MPETMKAIQIQQPGQAAWIETPVPELPPDEVMVRVESVTTCPHWDLHILAGDPMFPGDTLDYPYPVGQPGHEMAGEVVQVGTAVTDFRLGDKVVAWRDPGKSRIGSYAQYVPFATDNLLALPQDADLAQVTSLELAMCVQVSFDQLNPLHAIKGKRVVISGLGPAGLIAVQMAHLYGAHEVLAIDPVPARRRLATELGAALAVAPHASCLELPGHAARNWDTGMDFTGLAPSVGTLMELCQAHVHVFGVFRDSVPWGFAAWRKGLSLIGYARHNREAARHALQLVLRGYLNLRILATQDLPLSAYAHGVNLLGHKEAVKIRYLPWA